MSIPAPTAFEPMGIEQIGSVIRGDGDPIDAIGRNANWHYLAHTPALLNVVPYKDSNDGCNYVFPVSPSVDGLTYRAFLGWSAGALGADVLFELEYSAATDPQPATDGDWTYLTYFDRGIAGDAHEWTEADETFVLPADARFVRLHKPVNDGSDVHSLIIYPTIATVPTEAQPSGFVPYRDDHLLDGDGGPVHPELMNRIWRSVGYVLADRAQMVFSWAQSTEERIKIIASPLKPYRPLLYQPCVLRGQRGATITVQVGAIGNTAGLEVIVGEVGGSSVTITVGNTAGAVAYFEASLTLQSDEPIIYANGGGSTGTLIPYYLCGIWHPGD